MDSSNRLPKEEWEELDRLLGKHGFGGYYDLVESLKVVLGRVENGKLERNWEDQMKSLPDVVNALLAVT